MEKVEVWKDIVIEKNGKIYDYTGLYQVSNLGRVRSLDRIDASGHKRQGKVLNCKPDKKGYVYVSLCKNAKLERFQVHRLVATAFIPNPDNLPVVNHQDENPSNCHVDNLEWCTHQYNINYGTAMERKIEKMKGREFSEEQKQKMRDNHADFTGSKNPRARKIVCIETGQVFTTAKEARDYYGIKNRSAICNCCKDKQKTAGGYHWKYYTDYLLEINEKNEQLISA